MMERLLQRKFDWTELPAVLAEGLLLALEALGPFLWMSMSNVRAATIFHLGDGKAKRPITNKRPSSPTHSAPQHPKEELSWQPRRPIVHVEASHGQSTVPSTPAWFWR